MAYSDAILLRDGWAAVAIIKVWLDGRVKNYESIGMCYSNIQLIINMYKINELNEV